MEEEDLEKASLRLRDNIILLLRIALLFSGRDERCKTTLDGNLYN